MDNFLQLFGTCLRAEYEDCISPSHIIDNITITDRHQQLHFSRSHTTQAAQSGSNTTARAMAPRNTARTDAVKVLRAIAGRYSVERVSDNASKAKVTTMAQAILAAGDLTSEDRQAAKDAWGTYESTWSEDQGQGLAQGGHRGRRGIESNAGVVLSRGPADV